MNLFLFTPAVFLIIWKIYCYKNNLGSYLHKTSKESLNIDYIIDMFEERVFVFGEYIDMFISKSLNGGMLKITGIIGIIICILPLFFIKDKDKLKKYRLFFICIMIGLFCYCVGHLYLYLFVFSFSETAVMSAWVRYICGYLPACIFFAGGVLSEEKKSAINIIMVLVWIAVINWNNVYNNFTEENYQRTHDEQLYYADTVHELMNEYNIDFEVGENVCVLFEEQYYLIRQNINYCTIPAKCKFIQIENAKMIEEYTEGYDYYFLVETGNNGKDLHNIVLLEGGR